MVGTVTVCIFPRWSPLTEWLVDVAVGPLIRVFNERVQRGPGHVAFFISKVVHAHVNPQEHSEHLLSKEWLFKVENEKSVPYLMVRPSLATKIMACLTS